MTTIFWIGERPSTNNPVPNDRSSWDPNWFSNYGGYDDPNSKSRKDFIPMSFLPRQNPFYVALPYNDVEGGHTKPEAKEVIPWFKSSFQLRMDDKEQTEIPVSRVQTKRLRALLKL